ncbi:MAG: hypothetical protein HY319_15895 [Armatimonadetes bacterium]|nr:hypothetical protein [Armatimonadota bacterium]
MRQFMLAVVMLGLAASCPCPLPARESPNTRAVVLIDSRLHSRLEQELQAYVAAASQRRRFDIQVLPVPGLDDLAPPEVRARLRALRKACPRLEGVVLVGNVRLPSFFMPRPDQPSTRLWPRYYEDLDMVCERRLAPGTKIRGYANGDPAARWPFVIGNDVVTPEHDFDYAAQGPSFGPELWVAFLPVGLDDLRADSYDAWAAQLRPFLRKTLNFYREPSAYRRSLYLVSNDLTDVSQLGPVWSSVGPRNIDYYAIREGKKPRYVRAGMEQFRTLNDFLAYARGLPWMGEGWQDPSVFLKHMNAPARSVVWWNVHSHPSGSIISSQQARTAVPAGKGGLVGLVTGCAVAAYRPPGCATYVDVDTPPASNFLISVVYGPSAFVAASGCPFARVSDDCYEALLAELFSAGYLGQGHRKQLLAQDRAAGDWQAFRGNHEMLIGDPFVDASRTGTPGLRRPRQGDTGRKGEGVPRS